MIEWIKKAAPPMVILENVIGAPWKEKIKVMEGLGYYAAWVKVDTKDYYIPHTRQRGYLFAVKKDSSLAGASPVSAKATKKWADTVLTTLKRPASGALDAFMLPNDDPRVLLGRVRMATSESADNKSTDWSKCETRHLFARASEELGEKRVSLFFS
jgi:site-specific DNA-cytosine methylase